MLARVLIAFFHSNASSRVRNLSGCAFAALALVLLCSCARSHTVAPKDDRAADTAPTRVEFLRPSQRAARAAATAAAQGAAASPNSAQRILSPDLALLAGVGTGTGNTDALADPSQVQAALAARNASTTDSETWDVALLTLPAGTEGAQAAAQLAANDVSTRTGLPARALERSGVWIVSAGSFPRDDEAQARVLWSRVREMRIDEATPFANASLLAPALKGTAGATPEHDLALLRAAGVRAEFTLQIGIYQVGDGESTPKPDELREIRAAAEEAVKVLRADGHEAFYWHGPTRSTVTVGLFSQSDIQRTVKTREGAVPVAERSPRLDAAQKAFPHNLINGMAIRVKVAGADGTKGFQPSFLIRMP